MTPDQIDETISAYLVKRHTEAYPHCSLLEWISASLGSARDIGEFEDILDLHLTRLFTKPKVKLPARPQVPRHLVLAYFCLPVAVNRHLKPDPNLTTPLLPAPVFSIPTHLDAVPPMPPLEGRTDPRDELHMRKAPNTSADSLGVLAGHEAKISIVDKFDGQDSEGKPLIWYQIETLESLSVTEKPVSDGPSPRKQIPAGKTMWIAAGGVKIAAAPWAAFRRDLRQWEASEPLMSSVESRITLLRQRSHRSNLIFDEVIGTKRGKIYNDHLKHISGQWQMFVDYEAVVAPDGRSIDLQHLFVGLDALAHPERRVKVSKLGATFDIGTSWAAATWAGDLGSAVADSQTQGTGAWSSYARPRTAADFMNFFLQANAPDWDLLGDVDPWGIQQILKERTDVRSVDDLLSLYYEDTVQPMLDLNATPDTACVFTIATIVRRRIDSLAKFLVHYGFTFPAPRQDQGSRAFRLFADRLKDLDGQPGEKRLAREIHLFAEVWRAFRDPVGYALGPQPSKAALDEDQAVRYFMQWLALEAMTHCVRTDGGP